MRVRRLVPLLLLLVATPLRAGAIDDARAALVAQQQGDLGAAIEFYTRAIDAGELETKYLAIAFYNRGNARFARRDYVAALADYDIAVVLAPDYALAHNNRGNAFAALGAYEKSVAAFDAAIRVRPAYALAYKNRGNAHAAAGFLERAIADYDVAAGYAPDHAKTYNNRGNARFLLGHFATAVADYQAALEIDPYDLYSMLWLYLAETRDGADGEPALSTRSAAIDDGRWPMVVVSYYLGEASGHDILAETALADPATRRERQCEAYFYLGAGRLIAGDAEGARGLFREVIATGVAHFVEYLGARTELGRMAPVP